eukprot:CAMPEP_0116037434 /NCGR_PEP_ID=MMETSP0321-20121206/22038_1 /TAXON_ID=163516 /ORGANISM="Leptocylindrus danicus var. danicus, Strain B650" /LENGTH=66 /DNA_ID=CAMNT_0003515611 /DNA_START=97 /DNA_END=294 /DNA_ORIENTATION=+
MPSLDPVGTDDDGTACSKATFIQNIVEPSISNLFPGVYVLDATELRSAQQHVFLLSTSFDGALTIQ